MVGGHTASSSAGSAFASLSAGMYLGEIVVGMRRRSPRSHDSALETWLIVTEASSPGMSLPTETRKMSGRYWSSRKAESPRFMASS